MAQSGFPVAWTVRPAWSHRERHSHLQRHFGPLSVKHPALHAARTKVQVHSSGRAHGHRTSRRISNQRCSKWGTTWLHLECVRTLGLCPVDEVVVVHAHWKRAGFTERLSCLILRCCSSLCIVPSKCFGRQLSIVAKSLQHAALSTHKLCHISFLVVLMLVWLPWLNCSQTSPHCIADCSMLQLANGCPPGPNPTGQEHDDRAEPGA